MVGHKVCLGKWTWGLLVLGRFISDSAWCFLITLILSTMIAWMLFDHTDTKHYDTKILILSTMIAWMHTILGNNIYIFCLGSQRQVDNNKWIIIELNIRCGGRISIILDMIDNDELIFERSAADIDSTLQRKASCRRRAIYPTRELAVFVMFFNIVPIHWYFFLILLWLQ